MLYFQSGIDEWRKVFLLAAGVYYLGALMFLKFGSGEEQPWSTTISPWNAQSDTEENTDDSQEQVDCWKHQWVSTFIKLHFD